MPLPDIILYGLAGSVLVLLGLWVTSYLPLFMLEVGKFMIGRRTVSLQAILAWLVVGMLGLILGLILVTVGVVT